MATINLDQYVDTSTDVTTAVSLNNNLNNNTILSNPNNNSKKRKISNVNNIQDFKMGSIVKIKLKNFITYKMTEFNMSPSLNMIIGPNGSGKSTLVCAICLGLAGKPEFIGRMKKLDSFIKNGEKFCQIDIILRENNFDNKLVKITRIIYKELDHNNINGTGPTTNSNNSKKSKYLINNIESTEAKVKDLIINKFNIQLDNLCQLLSQERVEEFARLKSEKLLLETIRSIDPSLLQQLNNLKNFQNDEISIDDEINLKNDKLEKLNKQNTELSKKVSLLKDYETKKNEIELHKKLLPYVKIKQHKTNLENFKRDYRIAKNNLKKITNELKPFLDNQNIIMNDLKNCKLDEKQLTENLKIQKGKIFNYKDILSNLRDQISSLDKKIKYFQNRDERIKAKISTQEDEMSSKSIDLQKYISLLNNETNSNNIDSQKENLITQQQTNQNSLLQIRNKAMSLNHGLNQLNSQLNNKKLQLTTTDKIVILDQIRYSEDIKDAVLYIRQQRSRFQGKILEPPVMSVSMTSPLLASYLNFCVDGNTGKAFTIYDSETYENYSNEILGKFKVNLRELKPGFNRDQNRLSRNVLRQYGFEGYLSDFVQGNNKVIEMLCQVSNIHLIPISTRELTSQQYDSLINPRDGNIVFRKFIHGNMIVNVSRSNYGSRQIFSRETAIRSTNLYQEATMTDEQRREIENDINNKVEQMKDYKAQLETVSNDKSRLEIANKKIDGQLDQLNMELKRWNNIRIKVSSLKQDIETLKQNITSLQNETNKDVSHNITIVEDEIKQKLVEQTNLIAEMVNDMGTYKELKHRLLQANIKAFEFENKQNTLRDIIKDLINQEQRCKNEYDSKKEAFRTIKETDEFKEWMRQIHSYASDLKAELNEYAETYEQENSFNVQYVEDKIDKLQSEIATINHDTSAITILKQVQEEIEDLETTIPQLATKLRGIRANMKEDREVLEPALDDMVLKISNKFTKLFTHVGSAGAVNLVKPNLYNDWKIEIMVKFRDNASLKRLDSHTQSGGERAVSTVLYMIALQEFTAAPFRVVDEINQGMDQRNERIIHKAMVENACAEKTSQYFLITPKLLTDLYYHEKMMVHCVMAGPWIPNPSENPEMVHFGETSQYA